MLTKHQTALLSARIAASYAYDAGVSLTEHVSDPRAYLDAMQNPTVLKQPDWDDSRILTSEEQRFVNDYLNKHGIVFGLPAIMLDLWMRTRVVYIADTDAAKAVANTDWSSTVIPEETLRRLPHSNPIVVFQEPFDVPIANGVVMRFECFIVTGRGDAWSGFSSDNPEIDSLDITFLGRKVDTEGNIPGMERGGNSNGFVSSKAFGLFRIITPLADMSMEERIDQTIKSAASLNSINSDLEEATEVVRNMVTRCISLLVYLATDDVDATEQQVHLPVLGEVPRPKIPKGRSKGNPAKPRNSEPTTVVELGYRIGAALRAYKTESGINKSEPTGKTVAPHIRRAHLHTFTRGPGRSERFVKWLPPIGVNVDGALENTQVHFPN